MLLLTSMMEGQCWAILPLRIHLREPIKGLAVEMSLVLFPMVLVVLMGHGVMLLAGLVLFASERSRPTRCSFLGEIDPLRRTYVLNYTSFGCLSVPSMFLEAVDVVGGVDR